MQIRIETANLTKNLYIIWIALGILILQSCSYTKLVPDQQSLLWKYKIIVDGKKGAPSEAEDILKQQPNQKLGFNFLRPNLAVYNWGNGNDSNFFAKLGEAPVILDSVKVATGASQLQDWYFNKGYFKATSSYQIDSIGKKKAQPIYYVTTRNRYTINDISYEAKTKSLEGVIAKVLTKDSIIKKGIPYDAALLENLRSEITLLARNSGYYGFSKNYIRYDADTFLVGDRVNIKLVIDQANVDIGDSSYTSDHKQYYFKNIYLRPDYHYSKSGIAPKDTSTKSNYDLVYDTLKYKPRYLTDAVHFEKAERYSEEKVKETYSHIVGYKAFQLSDINFTPSGTIDSLGVPGLNATVNLNPLPKRTFTIEPEVTTSGGNNFGISGTIGVINRNLFRGGEALTFKINSGLEYQTTIGNANKVTPAFEIGGEISLEFPRFILPFINSEGLLPKRMQPQSVVSLSYNILSRQEFTRQTLGTQLSYKWKESQRKSHRLDLVDITFSQIIDTTSDFYYNDLSEIQRQAFTSEFISATRYTYTLNENLITRRKNPRYFRGTFEVAGNMLSLLDQTTGVGEEKSSNGANTLFNVQYFQYAKMELDARYYWNVTKNQSWINRVYTGYILPYGNSKIATDTGAARVPPFSKYFYMGGSNDMRAWTAYRLGAGRAFNTDYAAGKDTTFATGTFKLLLQTEYRFPIVSYLQGAIFLDAGNIWLTGGLENKQTDLRIEDLYEELALGGGIGLRLDFDFFVIRMDIGMKLRDPGLLDSNEEWVFLSQPAFIKNWTYNFALGYPF